MSDHNLHPQFIDIILKHCYYKMLFTIELITGNAICDANIYIPEINIPEPLELYSGT